jgi:hypothetical protein
VDVHDVVVPPIAVAPDDLPEVLTAEHMSVSGRERIQEPVLRASQVKEDAAESRLVGGRIHAEFAERARWWCCAVPGAALQRTEPRCELALPERFRDVVIGSDREGQHLVDLFVTRTDHDDVHVAELADQSTDLDAVDVRQRHVQHDQVGCGGPDEIDCGRAKDALMDPETFVLQQSPEQQLELGLVLDDDRYRPCQRRSLARRCFLLARG